MAKEEWGTKRICPETGKEITLDKSVSEKIKTTQKSEENPSDPKFDSSDELLTIDDDLILDEEESSSELDDDLLEEDDQDTVPLEEITDVPSNDGEEN